MERLSNKRKGCKQQVQSEAVATAQRTGGAGGGRGWGTEEPEGRLRGRVCGTRERDSQGLPWLLGKWGHLALKKGFGSSRSGSAIDQSECFP